MRGRGFTAGCVKRFLRLMRPMGAKVLKFDSAVGVHSEHDLKEQSDAQIIVSRFPFGPRAVVSTPLASMSI